MLLTGLVAILKAGSAYVPMDPDYPPDRLAIMAGDSKVCLSKLITCSHTSILKHPLDASDVSYSSSDIYQISQCCGDKLVEDIEVLRFQAENEVCVPQAPVILSQGDLQDKVAEVLEAVRKDQGAAGAAAALPQIVLVSPAPEALSPDSGHPCLLVQRAGVLRGRELICTKRAPPAST